MNISRAAFAAAVLLAAAGTTTATTFTHAEREGPIAVRVEVNYGLLDSCDAREVPHLVEHLALSETTFGSSPADLIENLAGKGVRVSATTRQDFTEYVFEGRPGTGPIIHDAIMQTLGRSQLPTESMPREIEAIRLELGREKGFTSDSHPFEEWAYAHIKGAPAPCKKTDRSVASLSHAKVLGAFEAHYGAATYHLTVVGPGGEIDPASLARDLDMARPDSLVPTRHGATNTQPLPLRTLAEETGGAVSTLEILIGIPGRQQLPPAKTREAAERVRLAVQAKLRHEPLAYIAKAVIHQSNSAGWISITAEVPTKLQASIADELGELTNNAYSASMMVPIDRAFLANRDLAENIHLRGFSMGDGSHYAPAVGIEVRYTVPKPSFGNLGVVTIGQIALIVCALLTTLLVRKAAQMRSNPRIRAMDRKNL